MRLKSVHCPLCNSGAARVRFRGPDRTLDRPEVFGVTDCKDCGFRYTSPRPMSGDMQHFYPNSYGPYQAGVLSGSDIFNRGTSTGDRLKNRLKWNVLVHRYGYAELAPPDASEAVDFWTHWLNRLLGSMLYWHMRYYYPRIPRWGIGARALDVGCGNGAHLLLLKRLGWDVSGFDLSDHTAQEVKAAGINVLTGSLEDLSSIQGRFDLITMWHVLEHVDDPLATLRWLRQMLAPHGILMLEIPNGDSLAARLFGRHWIAYDLPRHLSHFTPTTARRMLRAADMEVVHQGYSWKQYLSDSTAFAVQRRGWSRTVTGWLKAPGVRFGLKAIGHLLALSRAGETFHFIARKAGPE
jgi:2-polyprenyl-3-methyl-5-hydroxy-6-metoxy-1,4-benzoquinol methylase